MIVYKLGTSNKTAIRLSRFSYHDSTDKDEEGELALAVACEQKELEPFMKAVQMFLSGGTIGIIDKELYSSVRREAKNFIVLGRKMILQNTAVSKCCRFQRYKVYDIEAFPRSNWTLRWRNYRTVYHRSFLVAFAIYRRDGVCKTLHRISKI